MSPLRALVETWLDVRKLAGRIEKRQRMARLFETLDPADLRRAATWLSGEVPALGVGWRMLEAAAEARGPLSLFPEPDGPLTLADVEAAFSALAGAGGAGASKKRIAVLGRLLGRAGEAEREMIGALLLGELRQGALRALVLEAVGEAKGVDAEALRGAVMRAGSLGALVEEVARRGPAALAEVPITPGRPIEPMLAASSETVDEALEELGGEAAVEWKLDGVRVQLHRDGDQVRVFSRSLRDVTAAAPELVELARALPARSFILDGEVIALGPDGRPLPFQDLMSRFQREQGQAALRLEALFFDVLYLAGETLLERPDRERRAALERLLPAERLVPRRVVTSAADAAAVLAVALARGHEGVVMKSLDAPYAAGRRGGNWRKVKQAHTLDLVILAAEWGHGRRTGLLSNLHLGARDPGDPTRFWMLGKTFKGLTDAMLREQTEDLQRLAIESGPHVVRVRPERVVEIAFDGIQRSPRYNSGLALRFARVKRFRPDKSAGEATTIDEIRALAARKS